MAIAACCVPVPGAGAAATPQVNHTSAVAVLSTRWHDLVPYSTHPSISQICIMHAGAGSTLRFVSGCAEEAQGKGA